MQKTKTILVWPWKASNLQYHVLLDTFVNGETPSEPRSILPDSCFPDPSDVVKPPEPCVELRKNISAGGESLDLNVIFVAGTGLDEDDPNKARIDRARVTLSVSSSTVDAIVALILPDEKMEYLIAFHTLMFAKGLEEVPTFFVCLDDPTFAKGKEIQNRAMMALSNYGSNWHFKNISSKSSSSEVTQLFADVLTTASPATISTTPSSPAQKSTGGGSSGRERRGCSLF